MENSPIYWIDAKKADINIQVRQTVDMHVDWNQLSGITADHSHHQPDWPVRHRDNYLQYLPRSPGRQDQQVMNPWLPIRQL